MNPINKIKEIREKENLSQTKFSLKFGFPEHTIKNIEKGLQNIPDDLALKLEAEYNIPFKWWKTGTGEMFINEVSDEEAIQAINNLADILNMSKGQTERLLIFLDTFGDAWETLLIAKENEDLQALSEIEGILKIIRRDIERKKRKIN